jgi:hypothetical protein
MSDDELGQVVDRFRATIDAVEASVKDALAGRGGR